MASDKRHPSKGVFTAENAFYALQMAFLDPKMPFVRCLFQGCPDLGQFSAEKSRPAAENHQVAVPRVA